MIKERYVSPTVARMLQEKGFEESCNTFYCQDTLIDSTLLGMCTEESMLAPTQQMACDWLLTKDIFLKPYCLSRPFDSRIRVSVYTKNCYSDWLYVTTITRDTLEDTINDAIEYAVENLI